VSFLPQVPGYRRGFDAGLPSQPNQGHPGAAQAPQSWGGGPPGGARARLFRARRHPGVVNPEQNSIKASRPDGASMEELVIVFV